MAQATVNFILFYSISRLCTQPVPPVPEFRTVVATSTLIETSGEAFLKFGSPASRHSRPSPSHGRACTRQMTHRVWARSHAFLQFKQVTFLSCFFRCKHAQDALASVLMHLPQRSRYTNARSTAHGLKGNARWYTAFSKLVSTPLACRNFVSQADDCTEHGIQQLFKPSH